MKKCLPLLFVLIAFFCSMMAYGQNSFIKRIYQLPKGVSSKDYLPNTLIIKYKDNPVQSLKTFDTNKSSKPFALNITYQKPVFVAGDLSKATLSEQKNID